MQECTNQQQIRWLHWSRSFSLKIASWMRIAVPISKTKLAANWQDMVWKSATRSKQAVSSDEGDQLRGQPSPCLHQSFSKSDCHNLVGKCWLHKSWHYGNIWSSQRVEPTKLSQHAVGASTALMQRRGQFSSRWRPVEGTDAKSARCKATTATAASSFHQHFNIHKSAEHFGVQAAVQFMHDREC